MVSNKAERAVGEDARAYVEVSGIVSAQTECALGEAVLWDVLVGGGEDGFLDIPEWTRRRRMAVGVE
jgi:hypothetical protein